MSNFDKEEIDNLRQVYLNAEYDYFIELLKNKEIRDCITKFNENYSTTFLYEQAIRLIDSIENGEVKEDSLEIVEGQIAIYLAAIQDKELIKKLILYMQNEIFNERGLTR